MSKIAIGTGVLGQDCSFLAEYLISLGYVFYGVYRRVSSGNDFSNISEIKDHPRFHLIAGDICDDGFINKLISEIKPDEYYGLAAESHVGHSFKAPRTSLKTNGESVLLQLEAIRNFSPKTKFYNSGTSELWGGFNCPKEGFDEKSAFNCRSPYALAKQYAFGITKNYREAYGIFGCSGILTNHSSTRRGIDFATRKITRGVANIVLGNQKTLKMGNLADAFRDEGHSKDFVKAMHLILQQDAPSDYVVATGKGATIQEMLEYVCSLAELKYDNVYEMDERFNRPSDVPYLLGNPAKTKSLGWEPEYTWKALLKEMYLWDLKDLSKSR